MRSVVPRILCVCVCKQGHFAVLLEGQPCTPAPPIGPALESWTLGPGGPGRSPCVTARPAVQVPRGTATLVEAPAAQAGPVPGVWAGGATRACRCMPAVRGIRGGRVTTGAAVTLGPQGWARGGPAQSVPRASLSCAVFGSGLAGGEGRGALSAGTLGELCCTLTSCFILFIF